MLPQHRQILFGFVFESTWLLCSVHDAWLYHMTWGMLSKYQSLSVLPYFMSCASFALYKFEQDISSLGHLPGGHVDFLCTGAHETMHGDALSSGTFTDGQWMWWRRRGSRFFRLTSLHCVWKVTEPLFEYLNTDYFPLLAERGKKKILKTPRQGKLNSRIPERITKFPFSIFLSSFFF